MTGRGAAVSVRNLSVRHGAVAVLDNVSLEIAPGESVALVGPNGAGKTTLVDAILGNIPGPVTVTTASGVPARIGYVPQRFAFDRALPMTVDEFLATFRQRFPLWAGIRRRAARRSGELLQQVHAAHLGGRRLGALSGGELQRVLLAAALGQEPDLLILDEPGAGVDAVGEGLFCELLEHLRAERGFTQILVSHNLALVTAHAERVFILNRRLVAEGPPCETLSARNLEAAFGVHMTPLDGCPAHGRDCPSELGHVHAHEETAP